VPHSATEIYGVKSFLDYKLQGGIATEAYKLVANITKPQQPLDRAKVIYFM